MGASDWEYVAAWQGDVRSTLTALHQQVFQEEYSGDGRWCNLEEIWNDEEFMGNAGTHTIIDVYHVVDTFDAPDWHNLGDYNTMRPLSAGRIRHWFGTDRPSLTQYETLRDEQDQTFRNLRGRDFLNRPRMLMDESEMRWTGVYVVLYSDDKPTHVAFWGSSGD